MKASRLFAFAVLVAAQPAFESAGAQAAYSTQVAQFSDQQLDNLVAPVALYPDPILAQVLVAATFPDQIEMAARYVRSNGTRGIDDQSWDISVKAVAHYLPLLNMMMERIDWTTTLGQAYATQSGDVMDAVQRLREMARAQGNLESTEQQNVIVERERIIIVPAHPRYIYVPTYDPYAVYYRPVVFVRGFSGYWSFGIGFPIGGWLAYDCDWWTRRVFYDGWYGGGWGGWRHHSRPYIHVTNVYIRPRYEVVHVNRTVIHRTVNYYNLRPYNAVHRTVTIDRGPGGGRGNYGRDDDRGVDRRPGDVDRRVVTGRDDDNGRPGNGRGNGGGSSGNGSGGNGNGRGNDRGSTQPRGYVQYPDRVESREPERRAPAQGSVTYGNRPQVTPSRQAETQRQVPTQRPSTTQRQAPVQRPAQPQARTERGTITMPQRQQMPQTRQAPVRQVPQVRQPTVRSENYPTQRAETRPTVTRQSNGNGNGNGNGGGWGSQPSRAPSGSVSTGRAPTMSRSAPSSSSARSAPRGAASSPNGKAKGKG